MYKIAISQIQQIADLPLITLLFFWMSLSVEIDFTGKLEMLFAFAVMGSEMGLLS